LRAKAAISAEEEDAMGLMRRSFLLRAKYRGHEVKIKITLTLLGVHPSNRAGVYPMKETVMNLGLSFLAGAF
jgi:hypothetical protein